MKWIELNWIEFARNHCNEYTSFFISSIRHNFLSLQSWTLNEYIAVIKIDFEPPFSCASIIVMPRCLVAGSNHRKTYLNVWTMKIEAHCKIDPFLCCKCATARFAQMFARFIPLCAIKSGCCLLCLLLWQKGKEKSDVLFCKCFYVTLSRCIKGQVDGL